MELNYLRAFFEVAKSGSFTAAGRRLHVSQSALSRAVAMMEEAEGVTLFHRAKSGVSLTEIGEEVFRSATEIFEKVEAIENACRGKKETKGGPLRLGAADHITNYLLIPLFAKFRSAFPKITPCVFTGTPDALTHKVLLGELEFGLCFTKVNVPGIRFESLQRLPMAAVASPKLGARRARELLDKHGFVGSIRSHYHVHPSNAFLEQQGSTPPVSFESNSQEAQKRFCLAGGGVAFLARFMVEQEIAEGSLLEVPMKKPLHAELLLASKKGASRSPNAEEFLKLLR
jgi:DNA-binding transcriptional LysR family regulator